MALNEEYNVIFGEALEAESLTLALGTRKTPVNGANAIPVSNGGGEVVTEKVTPGAAKPVTQYSRGTTNLVLDTYAGIVELTKQEWDPDSDELLEEIIRKGAKSIAQQLDAEALSAFSASTNTADWDPADVWGSLVEGARGTKLDGFGFDSSLEADFYGAVDNAGRPLFLEAPYVEDAGIFRGRLLNRPAVFAEGVESASGAVGVAGGFRDNLYYGFGSDLNVVVSLTGAAGGRSALERNLVFVRVEISAGVVVVDADKGVVYSRVAGE